MLNLLFSFASLWNGFKQTWGESTAFKVLCIAIPVVLIAIIVLVLTKKPEEDEKEAQVEEKKEQPSEMPKNSLFEMVKPEDEIKEEVKAEPIIEEPVVEEIPEVAEEEKVEEEKVEEVKTEEVKAEPKKEKKTPAKKPATKKPAKKVEEKIEEPIVEEKVEEIKEEPKKDKKFVGKWVVESKSENEFMSVLMANNGEVMLTSESYTTVDGARNGIKTIIKAIETGEFVIYQDKSKEYYYKLKNANNRFLCAGEIYKTKDRCLKSVESVKRIAKDATVVEKVYEGAKYVEYTPVANPEYKVKKGFEGKWKVETGDDGKFSAKLYASNGQLMIATEYVSTKNGAIKAMENIKKNSQEGNFVIDKDKFGRFYYKLRNSQRTVICMGEAYDNFADCTSALESMRKFAFTATLIEE